LSFIVHRDRKHGRAIRPSLGPIVIDWPDATCGNPPADDHWSYPLLKLHAEEIADRFLDAYCRINPAPRVKILDWPHYVAEAGPAESVPGDLERLREIVYVRPLSCAQRTPEPLRDVQWDRIRIHKILETRSDQTGEGLGNNRITVEQSTWLGSR
jgi:hypothetical protein